MEVLATYIFYPIFSPALIRYIFVNQAGPGGLDRGAEAGGDRLAPFWFLIYVMTAQPERLPAGARPGSACPRGAK